MRLTLSHERFLGLTGKDVTVAVLDSGIHHEHPHVGDVQGGVDLTASEPSDLLDRIGHGTAVAAAIREKSPGSLLLSVKVFHRQLATNVATLARGIVWASDHRASIVNLSLGTANPSHAAQLKEAVARATACGAIVVSAREAKGVAWLPGCLTGVIGVVADDTIERDEIDVTCAADGTWLIRASPYPRPIPNVPRERNLSGVSFAVANASGFLARVVERAEGNAFAALDVLRTSS